MTRVRNSILIAGFVTDLEDSDVDLSAETSRLLQNQLRSNTRLQVLEPDRPPLQDALERALEKNVGGEAGKALGEGVGEAVKGVGRALNKIFGDREE